MDIGEVRGLESESPACTMYWVVVTFAVIGNSGKGAALEENLVSDVHNECEMPMNRQNGAIKEVVYVGI